MADPREVLTRPAEPGITIAYGDEPDQVVELFQPKGEPKATVVAIHGGFWREAFDRTHLRPFCHGLTAAGFAVVSLEYRRSGGAGGWPQTFEDIEAALELLDDELTEHDVDPDNVILTGHSAGGHLALLAADLPWAEPDLTFTPLLQPGGVMVERGQSRLRGVVALAPVSDLPRCYVEHLGDGAAAALMGGGPADFPAEYAEADPMRRELGVPVMVVHGEADDRVPVQMSRDYVVRRKAELRELPGIGHFEVIDPQSTIWPEVLDALNSLV
ncbi:alpha/beta hydrolase family protein [Stackebrandtia nassauensis]|uniref:BD-FAE-like domain-containing protein n=1 Tax=Stackebrandtia nassauensis (strain DSM 44728 / CIP 108903 / NRRL B-16338 / NBRC 102104 / LLR-40K-21) TaxID=446470 RepID=D3Q1I5_STANL|nr:alpha/beta hydrolase [Stackebrandtia nassauensis]ADD39833.1 conserved hypothetical protein [Stackebrandtia nassauensis DSM 44728]